MSTVPSNLPWGCVGSQNTWSELTFSTDSPGLTKGIVRRVLPGVVYSRPECPIEYSSWDSDPNDTLTYEILYDRTPEFTTLDDFDRRLVGKGNARQRPDEQLLNSLDHIVMELLRIAHGLHSSSNSACLGLIHPRNILLVTSPDLPLVALPDIGFFWDAAYGAARPEWLGNVVTDPWRFLWDKSPLEVNKLLLASQWSVANDLRTIARLVAWLLIGRERIEKWAGRPGIPLRSIPSADDAPETAADVWRVLSDVLCGKISTAAEFSSRLSGDALPSGHFRMGATQTKSPGQTRDRTRGLVRGALKILGGGGVVVLVAAVIFFFGKTFIGAPPPPAPTLCPDCPGSTKLKPELEKLYQLQSEPLVDDNIKMLDRFEQEIEILRRLHQPELLHDKSQLREFEIICLKSVRSELVKRLEKSFVRIWDDPNASPGRDLHDVPVRLDQFYRDLMSLSPDSSEQEDPLWIPQLRNSIEHSGM